jgi:hypothetical protein
MATRDDDRAAYLAGEDRPGLTADERAELDEIRGVLDSPATWMEPSTDLEDRVVRAIAEETAGRQATPRERRGLLGWHLPRPAYSLGGLALAAVVAIAVLLATSGNSRAPEQFAMAVSGTALAPDASGSATLTKTGSGWRIELSATGLPRLAGGRYYEAWLKSTAGVLVPVGTFNDASTVTLWAGVPPTEYPGFTVTRQRAGGSPASSGQRVLTGSVHPRG